MHGDIPGETFIAAFHFHHDADLAAVHVTADLALARDQAVETANVDILAELHHQAFARLRDGLRRILLQRQPVQRVHVGRLLAGHTLGGHGGERREIIALGDEVGLGIDLDHGGVFAVGAHVNADRAIGGDASGVLLDLRARALAQQVFGGPHVSLGLGERGLALHHAQPRTFAKFFDLLCGNTHYLFLIRLDRRFSAPS